jgi:hypothetical protein
MRLESVLRVARAFAISFGAWFCLSVVTALQYRVIDRAWPGQATPLDALKLAAARGFAYALLTPPVFWLVQWFAVRAKSFWLTLALYILGCAPFALALTVIRWILLPPWNMIEQRFMPRSTASILHSLQNSFADQITMFIAILAFAHAYEYFKRVRKQEAEKCEIQQALIASELQILKMQLHPHFLFNTLHGISTLIDSDHKTAKAMLVKLSNLLRTALDYGSSDLIPLANELGLVGEYLDLEKMRCGDRLKVTMSIDPLTRSMLLPQLILQPLVENAIRHGVASIREGGWVEIVSGRTNSHLEIRISNSARSGTAKGRGIGLRNTQTRLKHLYEDEAQFSFSIGPDQIATAILIVPVFVSPQQSIHLARAPEQGHPEVDHASAGCR